MFLLCVDRTVSSDMQQTELFSYYQLWRMCEHLFPLTAAEGLQCVNLRAGINFLLLPQTQETAYHHPHTRHKQCLPRRGQVFWLPIRCWYSIRLLTAVGTARWFKDRALCEDTLTCAQGFAHDRFKAPRKICHLKIVIFVPLSLFLLSKRYPRREIKPCVIAAKCVTHPLITFI